MNRFRSALLMFFTFIGGFYFFLEFLLPKEVQGFQFGLYHEQILKGVQVVGIMAIGLGILSIVRVHGGNIIRRRPNALNSAVLLISFITMLCFQSGVIVQDRKMAALKKALAADTKFLTLIVSEVSHDKLRLLENQLNGFRTSAEADLGESTKRTELFAKSSEQLRALDQQLEQKPSTDEISKTLTALSAQLSEDYGAAQKRSLSKRGEELFQNGLFVPLGSAMFALLAFYIATAAYRSFRVRSVESSLLMLTAVIVMLGQIPQGSIYISEGLPAVRLWLLKNISTPAFRAIFFGASIAGLAMAIRIWLSLERGPLSGSDE